MQGIGNTQALQDGVVTGHSEQPEAHHQQARDGTATEGHGKGRVHPARRGLRRARVAAHGDVHTDVAGGARQRGAHGETARHGPAERETDHDEEHAADRGDGAVLTIEVGLSALLDRRGDLLHTQIAGGLDIDPGDGQDAEDQGGNGRHEGEGHPPTNREANREESHQRTVTDGSRAPVRQNQLQPLLGARDNRHGHIAPLPYSPFNVGFGTRKRRVRAAAVGHRNRRLHPHGDTIFPRTKIKSARRTAGRCSRMARQRWKMTRRTGSGSRRSAVRTSGCGTLDELTLPHKLAPSAPAWHSARASLADSRRRPL